MRGQCVRLAGDAPAKYAESLKRSEFQVVESIKETCCEHDLIPVM